MTRGYKNSCETLQYYSVQLHPEQGTYLLGSIQVEPRAYDPFSRMEEILLALLWIGWRFRRGENVDLDAQRFCVRYGLLGFEQAEAEKRYEDGSVKLYADSVLHTKALTMEQQEYLFRPFQRELSLQRRQVSTGEIKVKFPSLML